MPRTTIRAYLTTENPQFILSQKAGQVLSTTNTAGWDPTEGQENWDDFSLDKVNSILGLLLDHVFDLPEQPPVLPLQLRIRDERSFESVLIGHNCIIVNAALEAACEYLGLPKIHWLVGSFAPAPTAMKKVYPDWAGICAKDPKRNHLPGESKYAVDVFRFEGLDYDIEGNQTGEHQSGNDSDVAMRDDTSSEGSADKETWLKTSQTCLEQINHYARCYNSRYCYLVSPKEVVLGRRRTDDVLSPSRSLAKNRATRDKTTVSESQGESALLSTSSPPGPPSSPAYTDHSHPDTTMKPVELCSIKWTAQGVGKMTFNLALWALHMVSAVDNKVEASYPAMDVDPAYQVFASQYFSRSGDS